LLPPRRPVLQASAEKALYFSDESVSGVERLTKSPFERVRPGREAAGEE
jgi:hypothetical protein